MISLALAVDLLSFMAHHSNVESDN